MNTTKLITRNIWFIVPMLAVVLIMLIPAVQLLAPVIEDLLSTAGTNTTTWKLVSPVPNMTELQTKGIDLRMEQAQDDGKVSLSISQCPTKMV